MIETILLLAVLFPGADKTGPIVTITVKAKPEVGGVNFTIGEIADITGKDQSLAARIVKIGGWASPLRGLDRMLLRGDVIVRLRSNGIDPAQVELVCPDQFKVSRGGQEASAKELIEAAIGAVSGSRKNPDENDVVEAAHPPVKVFVAPGKLTYQAGDPHGQVDGGMSIVPVSVLVDGKVTNVVNVSIKVRHTAKAVVAARVLDAKTVLTPEDLTVATIDVPSGAPAPLSDPQLLVGKRTTRRINQGQTVTAMVIEVAPVVASGAKVTLELVFGSVRICAPGITRAAGGVGEKIKVFAPDTKRELVGTVIDAVTIRVEEIQ